MASELPSNPETARIFESLHVSKELSHYHYSRDVVSVLVSLGQLKLSIDAQDGVLLLHSEYGCVPGLPKEDGPLSFPPGDGVTMGHGFFSHLFIVSCYVSIKKKRVFTWDSF